MKHTSLLASIAAAAGADRTAARSGKHDAKPHPLKSHEPERALTLHERINRDWKSDATLRHEFRGNFAAYIAHCERAEAQARGLTVSEIQAETPDIAGFIATLRNPTRADEIAANECAATWAKSPDIRREFRTFNLYASYMRAHKAGRARTFGA